MELDHVVLLVPYSYLDHPPSPSWLDNFIISPGGRHLDDRTENRLVFFRDGTYLELIAFINDDPSKRSGHWWDKPYGVVDFALTNPGELDYDGVTSRLAKSGADVSYAKPTPGGRFTDGHDIKWKVAFPQGAARGDVPFFCNDVTKREWRVPVTDANTAHPCGAVGMAGVLVEVPKEEQVERLSAADAAILNTKTSPGDDGDAARYEIGTPINIDGLKRPSIRLRTADPSSTRDQMLTLVLQTGTHIVPEPIRERIDDGLVQISFE